MKQTKLANKKKRSLPEGQGCLVRNRLRRQQKNDNQEIEEVVIAHEKRWVADKLRGLAKLLILFLVVGVILAKDLIEVNPVDNPFPNEIFSDSTLL